MLLNRFYSLTKFRVLVEFLEEKDKQNDYNRSGQNVIMDF